MKFDPRLSGLRGLAAASVLFYHLYGGPILFVDFAPLSGLWLVGVPIFLMLSIFLLLNVLDQKPSLGSYFKHRILRIWPTYFLFMGLAIVYDVYFVDWKVRPIDVAEFGTFTSYFVYSLTGTGGRTGNLGPMLGPFWTLQLEEWVYVILPLIWRFGRNARFAWTLIVVGIGWGIGITVFNAIEVGSIQRWIQLWYAPTTWFAAYGFGILAYLGKVPRLPKPGLVIVAVLILFGVFFTGIVPRLVFYPVILLAGANLIVNPPRWLARLSPLGEVSYGLYASQEFAYTLFGIFGILVAPLMAVAVELPQRPRQILARLRTKELPPPMVVKRRF